MKVVNKIPNQTDAGASLNGIIGQRHLIEGEIRLGRAIADTEMREPVRLAHAVPRGIQLTQRPLGQLFQRKHLLLDHIWARYAIDISVNQRRGTQRWLFTVAIEDREIMVRHRAGIHLIAGVNVYGDFRMLGAEAQRQGYSQYRDTA